LRGNTGFELELRVPVAMMLSDSSDERAELLGELHAAGM
jgi:hypothetical protein